MQPPMEFLIERKVPQRTAHEVIGRLVSLCERQGLTKLADLSDVELAEGHLSWARRLAMYSESKTRLKLFGRVVQRHQRK